MTAGLWTYNHRSPHGALSHKPPITRLDELTTCLHDSALGRALAQPLAQALFDRDRLTRYADAAEEFYDRRRVLVELNKSLHRIEIAPYDVVLKRARASSTT